MFNSFHNIFSNIKFSFLYGIQLKKMDQKDEPGPSKSKNSAENSFYLVNNSNIKKIKERRFLCLGLQE